MEVSFEGKCILFIYLFIYVVCWTLSVSRAV